MSTSKFNKHLYTQKDLSLIKTIYLVKNSIYQKNLVLPDNKTKLFLPKEIWEYIIFNFIVSPRQININDKCIIIKCFNGRIKEQYVTIDGIFGNRYSYNYGYYEYHEGICRLHEIREPSDEEKELINKNRFFSLPQQFYQSMPSF